MDEVTRDNGKDPVVDDEVMDEERLLEGKLILDEYILLNDPNSAGAAHAHVPLASYTAQIRLHFPDATPGAQARIKACLKWYDRLMGWYHKGPHL